MSRCFPYPPPGYERKNGALNEALINSIKLQKEREKAKKERKREKKEKEREREKARDNGGVEDKKQKHEKRHKNERGKVEHVVDHPKRAGEEAEQLEKSGLTEEHGQPVSFQNLYDSSDSTQNSHKRKRHSSSSDDTHNNHEGTIFRIRLKQKDQEILPSIELPSPSSGRTDHISGGTSEIPPRLEEKQCSTSGRQQQFSTSGRTPIARQETEVSLRHNDLEILPTQKLPLSNLGKTGPNLQVKYEISQKISKLQHHPTSGRTTVVQEKYENDPRPSEDPTCSNSGRTGVQALEIAQCARKSSSKLKKIESLYTDLIENWIPPNVENYGTDFDDQEWLFEKQQTKPEREPKRYKPSNAGVCQGSTSLWPRACYLPESDIHALPYTVPF